MTVTRISKLCPIDHRFNQERYDVYAKRVSLKELSEHKKNTINEIITISKLVLVCVRLENVALFDTDTSEVDGESHCRDAISM